MDKKTLEDIIEKKKTASEKQIIYRCDQWYVYRQQLKTELGRGEGLAGTEGYRKMGCDKCFGVNQSCDSYSDYLEIRVINKESVK